MKIIQVNSHYAYSSIGRTTSEMHEYLIKHGYSSYVFCINHKDEKNYIYRVVNKFEYRINGVHSRLSGLQAYFSHIPTFKMLKKWDKINPDIVILRNIHSDFVNLPMILNYCSRNKIPVIIVLHDVWFYTGHCVYYTKINCQKWQTMCEKCPGLSEGNPTWFFDRSKKTFNDRMREFHSLHKLAVIGVSNWVANEAKKSPMFDNATVVKAIYNWISLDTFKPKDTAELRSIYGINNEFVILGIAQNWSPAKGLFIFVEIAKNFPDCKVLMVGNIPDNYINKLPSNMILAGVLSDTSVLADHYSLGDVFINPSIQDTFGKVTAEALVCGTPVVVNDATGTPEVAGDCGIIVHNNNIKQFCEGIEIIRKNGKALYSQKCVERAYQMFEKGKNIEKYIDLFKQLCD